MIDSIDHKVIHLLLEEKAGAMLHLQRQMEELQHSLQAFIPADPSPIDVKGPSLQETTQPYPMGGAIAHHFENWMR
ncbi:hypothetical protein KBY82_10305 [Cyanobium sp. AMD-g]|uniref:hypothetical protein n=1 Tax=Cyanobium sp. AMD-g TaxID=2823699 RepID=UPI0020CD0DCE|nr:hypothetical protein [Cyanobium sp. AMD-g]MCP9931176.1 hypothetical protein [Cyanobium sp. AMD-g]